MLELALLIVAGAGAGAFGALLGLGGGLLIVPLLTLGFGLPLRAAVGTSLVCVVVTSSAAAAVYLQRDVANLRLGMTLELFTATAALAGGFVAFALPEKSLALLFALLLVYVAVTMIRAALATKAPPAAPEPASAIEPAPATAPEPAPAPAPAPARGSYVDRLSGPGYRVRNLPFGIAGSLFAGIVSALFGVGGGIVKVPVMHLAMGVPLRVATATSNLMIGVTASAGAIVYLLRPGGIEPLVAAPTALGVFAGASVASRIAHRVDVRLLRLLFVVMLLYTAFQMAQRGLR